MDTATDVGTCLACGCHQVTRTKRYSGENESRSAWHPRKGKGCYAEGCPNFDPQFADEWARRMAQRLDLDEYFEIFVQAHLKYLSPEDVSELLVRVEAQAKGGAVAPPTAKLQERLVAIQPALLGEITGETTETGAKLGSQIGGEIEKEHPEWTKASSVPATN
jgi:hypothetical protein